MTDIKDSRNKYHSHSHISDLLWHFIGPKSFENYEYQSATDRLNSLISADALSITLKPYTKDSRHYNRNLYLPNTGFGVESDKINLYEVNEPRAICFCDIPINSLPIHIEKYGDIGIGIRRQKIVTGAFFNKIKPVLYYPCISEETLFSPENNDRLWKINGNSVTLFDFVKIPTKVDPEREPTPEDHAEEFESIYEEREWRTTEEIVLSTNEIAFIIVPDDTHWKNCDRISTLVKNGLSLIKAKDLYRLKEAK